MIFRRRYNSLVFLKLLSNGSYGVYILKHTWKIIDNKIKREFFLRLLKTFIFNYQSKLININYVVICFMIIFFSSNCFGNSTIQVIKQIEFCLSNLLGPNYIFPIFWGEISLAIEINFSTGELFRGIVWNFLNQNSVFVRWIKMLIKAFQALN